MAMFNFFEIEIVIGNMYFYYSFFSVLVIDVKHPSIETPPKDVLCQTFGSDFISINFWDYG